MKMKDTRTILCWKTCSYLILLLISCSSMKHNTTVINQEPILISNIQKGKDNAFAKIQSEFAKNNPGYQLDYFFNIKLVEKTDVSRLLFIQDGGGTMDLNGHASSKFSVGDIVAIRPSDQVYADSAFSALVISTPDEFPNEIPTFIRPDWDPNITDIPGGCATETNAYRRILLTWKSSVGKYVYHSVNAHRVRIMDSFTHYHPVVGGFDEFYLVQMAAPSATLLTSQQVPIIENNEEADESEMENIIQSHPLKVGDFIYLPRGVLHRGLGNALVQVITVPGFVPGGEIGVDHHLLSINNRFRSLRLPYNKEASIKAIVK